MDVKVKIPRSIAYIFTHARKITRDKLAGGLSRLIWSPLKLVPPGTNFSETFGPTLKNLFPL